MQFLELFFNNEKEDAIYESWCFEPDPNQSNLGSLYIIAELKGRDSTSLNYLASTISNTYSNSESLEETISLTKQKIKERGLNKLDIAILTVKENSLTFAKTSGTKIALLRNNEVINIGSKLKGELTDLGTIKLKKQDKIIAITSEAWRKLRQKHSISKVTNYNKNDKIKRTLTGNDFPGVAVIVTLETKTLQKIKEKITTYFNFTRRIFNVIGEQIKSFLSKLPKSSYLQKRMITEWPDRKAREAPFLIAIFYLLSFVVIRTLVHLVGSINSPIAQTVKEGSSLYHFYIGRNIILFGYHIHHFYFGIFLIAIAGWMSITDSDKIKKKGLAIMYGIGLGLLMDEIGLLLTWGDYTSSLSYLLGVLVLGIILNIIYFPSFWKKVRGKTVKKKFGLSWLNQLFKTIIRFTDKITGRN
ncbi:MAG: hypothetical protein V5A57_01265 [Candidatus Paceibacterota bacterium]